MKFRLRLEARVVEEVTVDADTYEDAVALSKEMKVTKSADLEPTWIGTESSVSSSGAFEYEIICGCSWCEKALVSREIPGQPWLYGGDPENEHGGLVCFTCLNSKGYVNGDGSKTSKNKD